MNADLYCGSIIYRGYGKRGITFGGVRLSLDTLMLHSSISSSSSMGYSHFLNSIIRSCENKITAKLFSKERPSIEKEDFQASVPAE